MTHGPRNIKLWCNVLIKDIVAQTGKDALQIMQTAVQFRAACTALKQNMITFCTVLLQNGSSNHNNDGMLAYSYGIGREAILFTTKTFSHIARNGILWCLFGSITIHLFHIMYLLI